MSKKSRKRNKRLLMLAALAGGAAFLGRGKKKFGTDAGFLKSEAAGGASLKTPLVDAADAGTTFIKKKKPQPIIKEDTVVTNVGSPYRKTGITRQSGVATSASGNKIPFFAPGEGKGSYIKDRKYETGAMPDVNLDPYKIPTKRVFKRGVNYRMKAGGRVGANKGGSVTGIAKRGFGRALKK